MLALNITGLGILLGLTFLVIYDTYKAQKTLNEITRLNKEYDKVIKEVKELNKNLNAKILLMM